MSPKSEELLRPREAALQESGDMLLAGANIYAELGELLTDNWAR